MDKFSIAVAYGDGIGREIMEAVLQVFAAVEAPLTYQFVDMGKAIYEQGHSTGMTPEAKATIEATGILFKGPMETPKGQGVKSINVTARKVWSTFANKRVFKSLHGVETVFSKAGVPINLTIVRENIEDTYGGIEHFLTHDVALCRRFITRPGSLQVHRYAFEMARRKGAKRITCAHKANIMKLTDGLFLDTFYSVAEDYPELRADDVIIDDLAMKLVVIPDQFDVIVLPNLQGDIISDLCAGLVGGLGFAPSANIGERLCIFEAVHGTAPDIAGKNLANPTALLLSGTMLLRHLHLSEAAERIEQALHATLAAGYHTADVGDQKATALSTQAFIEQLITHLPPATTTVPETVKFTRAQPPDCQPLLATPIPSAELRGVDVFVESQHSPTEVAALCQQHLPASIKLTMISNRGTQVYPTGSLFTECINQYRVRLESEQLTATEVFTLAQRITSDLRICSLEMLMHYDGKAGYTLAQGQ